MKICGIDPSINSTGKCLMELDNNFDIVSVKLYGYNKTKSRCLTDDENVFVYSVGGLSYTKKNVLERQTIAYDLMKQDMEGVEYAAFEDYSMGSQSSSLFQIGEFVGGLKKAYYDMGIGIMKFAPKSVKRYATGSGSAGKLDMQFAYKSKFPEFYHDLIDEIPLSKSDSTPTEDLIDSFWIADILRNLIKAEALGVKSLPDEVVTRLMYKSTKKSKALAESELMKKPLDKK